MTTDHEIEPQSEVPDDSDAAEVAPEPLKKGIFRRRRTWLTIVMTLLLAAAAAGAVWQYTAAYRPDVASDSRVAADVVAAARAGTVAILSYSPDTLQRDFATARSHLSGNFGSYFDGFTKEVVTPAATEKKVKTAAEVTRAAVSELHPDTAKVLVFVNQTTTSTDKPDPVLTSSSVLVTLDRHGDSWLISGFDPV